MKGSVTHAAAEEAHGHARYRAEGAVTPYLFVMPALLYLFCFWGYPAGYAFYLSLTDTSLGTLAGSYTGLENYRRLFQDPLFWISLRNSGVLLAACVPLEV